MIKITKEFLEEHAQKMSVVQMAKTYGLSEHTIRHKEVEFGIKRSQYKDVQAVVHHFAQVKHTMDLTHFENMDEIGCYFLGLAWGDGSLFEPGDSQVPRFSIALTLSDRAILDQFREDFKMTTEVKIRKAHSYKMANGKICDSKPAAYIHIVNISLAAILCKYGMEPGPNYKRVIPSVFFIYDFLRGFLDSDGFFRIAGGKNSRFKSLGLRWCCTYEDMGNSLMSILKNIGYKAFMYKSGPIWNVAVNNDAEDLASKMWHNPKRFLKRKYDIYLNWLEYRKTTPPYHNFIKDRNAKIHARIAEGAKATDIMKEFNLSKTQTYAVIKCPTPHSG